MQQHNRANGYATPIRGDLAAWERNYGPNLASSQRDVSQPWHNGLVHIGRDVPAQPEPVVTGGLYAHQVVLGYNSHYVRDWIPGRRPHFNGITTPGSLFVVPANVLIGGGRSVWNEGGAFACAMIAPETVAAVADNLGLVYDRLDFIERYNVHEELTAALVNQLAFELEANGPGGRVYADQLLLTLAAQLIRAHAHTRDKPHVEALFEKAPRGGLPPRALRIVRELVAARFGDADLSLDDLAGATGYSAFHFARSFRTSTGTTPAAYLRAGRMEHAAELLADGSPGGLPVRDVALACGYRSASAFSVAFRKHFGASPSDYRRARSGY